MSTERSARLRALLERVLQPVHLEIVDDSRSHAGHDHGAAAIFP